MKIYKTPGVYIEEISTLPPSVAEVSTAVPAFFGYTAKGSGVAQVSTLLEFETLFGGAKPTEFTVKTAVNPTTGQVDIESIQPKPNDKPVPDRLLYYCISHYFKNGGGPCYIISLGNFDKTIAKQDFLDGLALLEKEDEPTLIVLSDAILLAEADYFEVCQAALSQCNTLKDRFLVLDVPGGKVSDFRNGIGTDYLSYAAAYHPYLATTLNFEFTEPGVEVETAGMVVPPTLRELKRPEAGKGIVVSHTGGEAEAPKVVIVAGDGAAALAFAIDAAAAQLTITNTATKTGADIAAAWTAFKAANATGGFDVKQDDDGSANVAATAAGGVSLPKVGGGPGAKATLASLKTSQTALYNKIKEAMGKQRVTLPPSATMAGIYARVDRDRGVWKAPANVSVFAVTGPTVKITDAQQESLNVDPTAGKSINAIRDFTGKGTLVWGARTLAGNDNEWRYVPVRRLFITIEESTKKASAFAVFEPNDATTWLKVKGMIESYLYGLWERGALAGSTPDAAYYVNVGLGKTMTPQDVLEGRLIVEIGVAAVRPAEFVVIRFMHKLQEA